MCNTNLNEYIMQLSKGIGRTLILFTENERLDEYSKSTDIS